MQLSDGARLMIGIAFILIPTIEFGGTFLRSQIGSNAVIRSEVQRSYFRAGHAHAGVLVILAILAQLLLDATRMSSTLQWALRIGFVLAPMLISAGFFLGAPSEGTKPTRLIGLLYAGAGLLAIVTIGLGLGLLFP